MSKTEYKLQDAVEAFIDYRGKTPPKTNEGVPLITAKIVKDGKVLEPTEFLSESVYMLWMTRGFPKVGDLVLTTEAPLGEVALLKEEKVALGQRIIAMRGKPGVALTEYLKYYFQSSIGQAALQSRASGSTVEGIKAAELRLVDVYLPSLAQQQGVVEVLLSIDDKIDLLHQQNRTLEQMAETLYRQWFVEEASDEWPMVTVKDVATLNPESISRCYTHEIIEYLDTGSITEGVIDGYQTYNRSEAPSRAQRIVQKNDIVYSLVRPSHRHYGLLTSVAPNTVVSTGFCVLRSTKVSPYFLYKHLTQEDVVEYFHIVAEGSTSAYPSLRPSDIGFLEFALPPFEKMELFSEFCASAWEKIEVNNRQIQTLKLTRDTLLPKLMSGEISTKTTVHVKEKQEDMVV